MRRRLKLYFRTGQRHISVSARQQFSKSSMIAIQQEQHDCNDSSRRTRQVLFPTFSLLFRLDIGDIHRECYPAKSYTRLSNDETISILYIRAKQTIAPTFLFIDAVIFAGWHDDALPGFLSLKGFTCPIQHSSYKIAFLSVSM